MGVHLRAVLLANEEAESRLTGETDRPLQRRRAQRRALRLAAYAPSFSQEAKVLIRDISEGGLLLEADPDALSTHDRVEISLPSKGVVGARVTWRSGRYFGCQFSEPISVGAISAALLMSEPKPESEDRSRGNQTLAEPGLNLSIALIVSLGLWSLIGVAAYVFTS